MNDKINQNAINPSNENMNNANNKTNTFNLIIGIATLLIALLGATFAYFSATARSAENDVTVKSAYVSISYDGGTEIKASNLIPATQTVAIKKYQKEIYALDEDGNSVIVPFNPEVDGEINTDYDTYRNDINRKCVDAKGKEVCYVYQFTIISDGAEGSTTDILASIKINKNEFDNLSYMLYEVNFEEEEGAIVTDKYGFGIVNAYNPVGTFTLKDENPDNLDFTDSEYQFAKFEKPYDIKEEGNLVETVNPIACLFGYVDDVGDKRNDDTTICKPYPLTNKVKHTYQLLIWLEETGVEQPEQGMTFEGTVSIEVSGGFDSDEYQGGQITGQE